MKRDYSKEPIYIEPTTKSPKYRDVRAIYQCGYCGIKFTGIVSRVISGKTISCGCQRRNRRSDHTKRQLTTWGVSKTTWVGLRFLSHARLQPRVRAAADAKLMKSLGIRDKDILFKAAQAVKTPASLPTNTPVSSNRHEPVHTLKANAPTTAYASSAAPKQPVLEPTHTTIINVQGDLNMNVPKAKPSLPYELTAEGQAAVENYYWQNHEYPPEGFDLKAWAQQGKVN